MRAYDLPAELDDRLREWAHYFRDRRFRQQTCASAEKLFRPHSEDFAAEGWGDYQEAAPRAPSGLYSLQRAIRTHEVIFSRLDVPSRWAITYHYAFSLPRGMVLGAMRHRTKRRYSWAAFCDLLDAARMRVYSYTM